MSFLGPVGKGIEGVNKYHVSANGQRIVTDLISSYSYWSTASSMTDVIRVFEEKVERKSSTWVQIGQNLTSAGEEGASFAISADGNRVAIVEELGGDVVNREDGCSSSNCPRAIIRVWDYHDEKKEWVQVGGVIDLLHVRKIDNDRICLCLGVVSLSMSADGNRLAIQLFQLAGPVSWYDVDSCYRIDVYQFQDGSSNFEEANWTPLGSAVKETCSTSRLSRRPFTVRMSGNGNRLSICNEVLEMYYFNGDNFQLKHSWEVDYDCNMDLNHDGTMIVFQSSGTEVNIWNVVEGIEVAFIESNYSFLVESVSMDSVGKLVVVGGNDERVHLWNGEEWSSFTSQCTEYPLSFSSSIVLSKDGNRIATRYDGWRSDYRARVTLFDLRESKKVKRFNCAVIPEREKNLLLILSIAIVASVGLFLFVFAKVRGNRAAARGQGQGNDQEQQQQQEQGQEGAVYIENICLGASGGDDHDGRERLLVKLQSKQKVFVVRYMDWGDNNNKGGKLVLFSQQPGENGESIGGWLDVDDSCTICLEPYEVNQEVCFAINSACIHYFHLECMLKWLLDHEKCPMCYATYLEDADKNTHV